MSQSAPLYFGSEAVYNAPMALNQSLTRTRGLEPERAKHQIKQRLQTCRRYTIGPMPPDIFLNQFLAFSESSDRSEKLSSRSAFSSIPSNADTAAEIGEPLINALNKKTKHKSRCPGYEFLDTSVRSSQPRKMGYMKPHISCYTKANAGIVSSLETDSRCDFGYAELFIEVKPSRSHDFFIDPIKGSDDQARATHNFVARSSDEPFAKHRDRAMSQHIAYATEIFARQHRIFLFTISVSGSCARLLRWDRAGCIVSESFDIRSQPEILCEFLWRFSQLSGTGRGHDPTVNNASAEEENFFHSRITAHVKYQLHPEDDTALSTAVSEHYLAGNVAVMHVLEQDSFASSTSIHRFLVSRPVVSPLSLTGRGTRGYWAVDTQTERVVFLKDTWRGHEPYELEGDLLNRMNGKGVRNTPLVVCHGDVPRFGPPNERDYVLNTYQSTMTDEFTEESWVCRIAGQAASLGKHWHYRLVLGTVGSPLRTIRGSKELLHVTLDVFHAMRDALEKDSRIHRDISIGNIVMVRESGEDIRHGYLIDWESSCEVDTSGQAVEIGRAGTWYFMSIETLLSVGLERKPTVVDDIESLLYVILYCSLLWLRHSVKKMELAETIYHVFEYSEWFGDHFIGGHGKDANAANRFFTSRVDFNTVLKNWLDTFMEYRWPVQSSSKEDRWTDLDFLDAFWKGFLDEHTVPDNDRYVHDHPLATDVYSSLRNNFRYVSYSTEAISLHKRLLPVDENESPAIPPKRARRLNFSGLPFPVRRSDRIRKAQKGGSVEEKLTAVRGGHSRQAILPSSRE